MTGLGAACLVELERGNEALGLPADDGGDAVVDAVNAVAARAFLCQMPAVARELASRRPQPSSWHQGQAPSVDSVRGIGVVLHPVSGCIAGYGACPGLEGNVKLFASRTNPLY